MLSALFQRSARVATTVRSRLLLFCISSLLVFTFPGPHLEHIQRARNDMDGAVDTLPSIRLRQATSSTLQIADSDDEEGLEELAIEQETSYWTNVTADNELSSSPLPSPRNFGVRQAFKAGVQAVAEQADRSRRSAMMCFSLMEALLVPLSRKSQKDYLQANLQIPWICSKTKTGWKKLLL